MSRLFKASYKDRKGKRRESSKWYREFRDQNDRVRRLPAFTSKTASSEFGRNLDQLVAYHRASGGRVESSLVPWVENLPFTMKRKLIEIGLLDSRWAESSRPLTEHTEEWGITLQAKGDTPEHVQTVTSRATRIINECGFDFWSDIKASKVLAYLGRLRMDEGNRGTDFQFLPASHQAILQVDGC